MKEPILHIFDLNTKAAQKVLCVTHTDDNSVDVIQLRVVQNGLQVDLSGATITARMVMSRTHELLSDNVVCSIDGTTNDILIPIDNKVISMRKGLMFVEVNVRGVSPETLTLQFPLLVRVNGSILDDAEITPESKGTIPELLEAAQEALDAAAAALEDAGDYSKLDNKPQINGHTLSGNKTSSELGLQDKLTAGENVTIDENGVISAEGGSQIVSGVVNQNGTITFNDGDGVALFTTSGGNLVTSGNQQISMGYDNGGFYFLFDDGQEAS